MGGVRRSKVVVRHDAILPEIVALPDVGLLLVPHCETLRHREMARVAPASRVDPIEVVEAALLRQVGALVHTQMPLPNCDSFVPRLLQFCRQELLCQRATPRLRRVND